MADVGGKLGASLIWGTILCAIVGVGVPGVQAEERPAVPKAVPRHVETPSEIAERTIGQLTQAVREREKQIQQTARLVRESVVALTSESPTGTGSGVIVSKEGLVLTAAHVTDALEKSGAKTLVIIFPDGTEAKAKPLGANLGCDSAMVQIMEPKRSDWPCVTMGQSDEVKRGDWVVALGQPGGFESGRMPPVRAGRVWGRDTAGSLFTDCTLVGGDSGGPLFNLEGKLIGIHSSIGGSLNTNRHVPIDNFEADWDRLSKGDHWGTLHLEQTDPERPVIGVKLDEASAPGLKVLTVMENSPASRAGMHEGDVMTHFDGVALRGYLHYVRLIARKKAGESVPVVLQRDKETVKVTVGLVASRLLDGTKAPPDPVPVPPRPWIGLEIEDGDGGVKVVTVDKESPAEKAGFQKGDVLLHLEDKPVGDTIALGRRLGSSAANISLKLKVRRGLDEKVLEVTPTWRRSDP